MKNEKDKNVNQDSKEGHINTLKLLAARDRLGGGFILFTVSTGDLLFLLVVVSKI